MISKKLQVKIRKSVKWMQNYAERWWYPPLIGVLAAIDSFVLIVPNDGILISSAMLTPKRWIILAFCISVGSTLGGVGLAAVVELNGLPWIMEVYPGITESQSWIQTARFFESYGLVLVFAVSATPLVQQPALILAGLANTPLVDLTLVVFSGRLLKFLLMSYIGSHAPRVLGKMWGLKGELSDVGVDIPSSSKK